MKCVFLDSVDRCYAELRGLGDFWKVDKDTKDKLCMQENFQECPRYRAKMDSITKR